MNKISIIVPVYNVEQYLSQCVKSLLAQSVLDLEIILVDDGSTDSSPLMCDEYAKNNSCIKVIHRPNGGLAAARNTGLTVASGGYVMFVDSDDFIRNGSLAEIAAIIAKSTPEVLLGRGFYYFDQDNASVPIFSEYDIASISNCSGIEALSHLCMKYHSFFWSACVAVYKMDFLRVNHFSFAEGFCYEDILWSFDIFGKAKSVSVINNPYYYYRQKRSGSIMASPTLKSLLDCYHMCEMAVSHINSNHSMSFEAKRIINGKLAHIVASNSQKILLLADDEQKHALARLKEFREPIMESPNRRCRVFALLWRIAGIKNTLRILGMRRRLIKNNME